MKNTKQCPKCGSSDIYRFNGFCGAHGSGNNILTGISTFSAVNVHRYVCCTCGFTEEWVDREDLNKLKNCKKAIPVK